MPGAVVVGGGVVGASTAYHLARSGVDTLLLDRADPGRATAAGAGIVSPESSRHADPDWYDLAAPAARYYPDLVDRLERHGETGYAREGTLVVAADPDEREAFEAARRRAFDRRDEPGHPPADALYDLDPAEARERVPPLADVEAAFFYEGGARVDGQQLTAALLAAGEAAGLETRTADVTRLVVEAGRVAGVETATGERVDAPAVVVAGGAWSPAFADQLGVAVGVREVLEEALRVAPGLADAELDGVRVGLRPVSEDGLPVVGPVPGVEGAYLATGHGPTGLTVGPYTGKLVGQLVRGERPERDLSAFDPGRF